MRCLVGSRVCWEREGVLRGDYSQRARRVCWAWVGLPYAIYAGRGFLHSHRARARVFSRTFVKRACARAAAGTL